MAPIAWPPMLPWVDLPFQERLLILSGAQVCVALYLHFLVFRARVGLSRFVLSLPALLALLAAPTLFNPFTEVITRCSLLFTCAWLGTHKVLAMCLNRGSLATPMPLVQFVPLLYLPIFPQSSDQQPQAPQGRLHDKAAGPVMLFLQALGKTGLLGLVVYLLTAVPLPAFWKHLCFAFGLVGFLGIIMDGPASLVTSLIGLRIIPTFDRPWLSASMADFWGRRWNITTSSVLRVLYYDPLVEGCLIKPDAKELVRAATSNGTNGSARGPTKPGAADSLKGAAGGQPGDGRSYVDGNGSVNGLAQPRPARTPRWRKIAGTFATFLASGLAHEFIINMLLAAREDGSRPWMWKWTAYFSLQAPLLVTEVQIKRMWRAAGLSQPNIWLARVVTIWFLIAFSGPLFFAPVDIDSDLAARVVKAVKEGFASLAEVCQPFLAVLGARLPVEMRGWMPGSAGEL